MPATSYLNKNFKSSYYHQFRPNYPSTLVQKIIDYHQGKFDTLLDVGCGTGIATVTFSKWFKKTIGIDPSVSMLDVAKARLSSDDNTVSFREGFGEKLLDVTDKDSVDMIIGAESIHWCDLDKAFDQAYKVLKPKGTFAFWFYAQPEFIDLDNKISKEVYYKYGWSSDYMGHYLTDYQRDFFTKFDEKSSDVCNRLKANKFNDIEFKMSSHSLGETDPTNPFYMVSEMSINDFRKFVRTWSLYTSWKNNHPNETKDIADVFIEELVEKCNIKDLDKPLKVQWSTFYYICRK